VYQPIGVLSGASSTIASEPAAMPVARILGSRAVDLPVAPCRKNDLRAACPRCAGSQPSESAIRPFKSRAAITLHHDRWLQPTREIRRYALMRDFGAHCPGMQIGPI
jgi:endogenous inhibitor of DNA gyrase (YacG/DUF329 family)